VLLQRPPTLVALVLSCLCLESCGRDAAQPPLFRKLPPDRTGVTFVNTITTSDSVNVQTDVFVYNGAGVAIGDIDNDGLPDVFFTGNMVSSRLYLNQGDMRFVDITESAGVVTDRWATGASMVDIDADGYLDIYVSVSGPERSTPEQRANLLFRNNGNRTFTEAAAEYQVADTGFTSHAAFLDYDLDGDLDLYVLTNAPSEFARGEAERHPTGARSTAAGSYDQLYRNNGDGTFTNVSTSAGILREVGFGLGVAVSDLNRDGWPDIYVSNDDTPSDVLYVNNGDGTSTDKASQWLRHTSFAGMGIDIADFNNDGWPDILQMDMMPEDLTARKRLTGAINYSDFLELRRMGFHYAYNLNTLQLHQGLTPDGDVMFSEIARLAGVAHTHWSWAALFGDYDNDGYKDILITNGYPKAVIDYDYQIGMYSASRRADRQPGLAILDSLHSYEVSNYAFRNRGDLTFADATRAWGMDDPGLSYGAAYGDLNNDGRLDLVINNIDAAPFIYENVRPVGDSSHFLQVVLEGERPNTRGVGATVVVVAGGQRQHLYQTPYRGYVSTVDDRLHFGLGGALRVDSLEVIWPDRRYQVLTNLPVDRTVTVRQAQATRNELPHHGTSASARMFQPMAADRGLAYEHHEPAFVDLSVQPLLPYLLSRRGPPLAVGDVTGDGLDDIYIGGAAGVEGTLFTQRADGRFIASTDPEPWAADKDYEDWGARFVDADGDGRPDLYVASGGYHLTPASPLLQDRLYINQGSGRFVKSPQGLPAMPTSTAAVAAGDFDGDGQDDLFVGGRLVPGSYPYPARSYVLRNDGGTFTDVTDQVLPELAQPAGMITDALWVDFTGDGRVDLVTVGEWMPAQFYANDGAQLRTVTRSTGLPPMRGWWYSLAAGDFNNDGHLDLVAGNLGVNYTYTTSPTSRFGVYGADFTGNFTTDIVLTQEIDGTEYPYYGLATLGREIYTVGVRFTTFASFASVPVEQVFSASQLKQAVHYQVDTFASVYLQNNGNRTFTLAPLPNLAQIAPIRGIIAHDVDRDGNLDLIVAGNMYHSEPNTPRADAGNGLWLKGDGRGQFAAVPPSQSGLLAPLDVTGLALIGTPKGSAVVVANNGASLSVVVLGDR